jgi:hypothetical protein
MKRTVVETIERELDRRDFLRRAALVAGAFVTGLLVAPKRASAKPEWGCCSLCFPITGSCTWPPDCACVWCWVCPEPVSCLKFKCYECIMSFPSSCTPQICQCWTYDKIDACRTCAGVVCSAYQILGRYYPCMPA